MEWGDSATVNVACTTSSGTYSQCVSNIGTESVQTLSQVQPPKPSEWKEIVRDDQELINPRFVSRCLMLALVCIFFWWTMFSFCKLRMKNVLLAAQASVREKEYGKKSFMKSLKGNEASENLPYIQKIIKASCCVYCDLLASLQDQR